MVRRSDTLPQDKNRPWYHHQGGQQHPLQLGGDTLAWSLAGFPPRPKVTPRRWAKRHDPAPPAYRADGVAIVGSELWWKGNQTHGTIGGAEDLQSLVVNQEARITRGVFQTTNQGCLSLESRMRPTTVQLNSRRRRFGLRLGRQPEGDQVKELDCAVSALGFSGRVETTFLQRNHLHSGRRSSSMTRNRKRTAEFA